MIEASRESLEKFAAGNPGKPVVLVQLLRFEPGGVPRYIEYSAKAQSILREIGAQILYAGQCTEPLLASDRPWDAVVVIRYPTRAAYVQMLADPAFQAITPLRKAAVREAMLLPMDDWPGR